MMFRPWRSTATLLVTIYSLTSPTNAFSPSKYRRFNRIHPKAPPFLLCTAQDSTSGNNNSNEIPANLKRKVRAKRPTLGHVVPKAARRRTTKESGGSTNPQLRLQGRARESGLVNPSMLKIISGSARGKRLDSPTVYLRPMMGKVREALFSTLTSFGLYDSHQATRHLDIFAGSGSVGLESLSRGAVHCTFVDFSDECCACVERNVKWCQFDNLPERTQVVCADYLVALLQPESVGISSTVPFDVLTLSPPYEEVTFAELLEAVVNSPLVGEDTIVVIEYPTELGTLPHVVSQNDGMGAMVGVRNRRYGRTVIAMYIVNPSGSIKVADSRPEEFVSL